MRVTAFLALGSNLGDRQANLDQALEAIQEHPRIELTQVSSFYETEPVGGPPNQDPYLNAVAEVETDLPPEELLAVLLEIEQKLGRVRRERYAPRTIDLDILLYGDRVIETETLTVPHPRMHTRGFVLEPFAEIAPSTVHPGLGVTIGQLWEDYDPDEEEDGSEDEDEDEDEDEEGDEDEAGAAPRSRPAARPRAVVTGKELAGLKALVTGSTGGIGRAIALELAAAGADVIIHGRRTAAAEQVAKEVGALGVNCQVKLHDLMQLEECRHLVRDSWDEWGPIDIWVNNAGADVLTGEAADWPFAHKLRELLEVDVVATLLMSRDIGRRMREHGSGVIINMGWDKADCGMAGDSPQLFAATKGAVMAFSKCLALELAPDVRVNCVAPGWIKTAWGENASEGWQNRVVSETPLERWGEPEDVAAAVRWLVSPAAAFVTGQVLRVNGGVVR